jgi:hypothetical protein
MLEFVEPFMSHIAFAGLIVAQFSAAVIARGIFQI